MNYNIYDKGFLITKFILALCLLCYFTACSAIEIHIYDFPVIYSQNANDYLSPDDADYNKSLLSPTYQHLQLKQFYNHYYSSDAQGLSPWSAQMIKSALPFMKKVELEILEDFSNQNKLNKDQHYAENFKEQDQNWWNKIRDNMDLSILAASYFKAENRAISVTNTYARALPDMAPDFLNASLPGQGFPFDNLQESAIWAGTPLYVFSVSKDKAWSLVLTPDGYCAWVKSSDIAYVTEDFMHKWQAAAKRSLIAVTQIETSIVNKQNQFQFT